MTINRREFIKLCLQSGIALSLSPNILKAFSFAQEGNPPVIWLQGASDSGCSISLLNSVHPEIKKILFDIINLKFHQTIMAGTGGDAVKVLEKASKEFGGKFLLVVEGAIPVNDNGAYCLIGERDGKPQTLLNWIKEIGPKAKAVIAAGSCASYGAIPAASPNPAGAVGVSSFFEKNGIKTPVINIPGCPFHPDWFVGTLSHVILYGLPDLDEHLRPRIFFSERIHENCPRIMYYIQSIFAKNFGDEECLYELGCKGPVTNADCYKRLWNNKTNWCIGSGGLCIGCVQPGFPDKLSPIFGKIKD